MLQGLSMHDIGDYFPGISESEAKNLAGNMFPAYVA